MGAPKLRSRPGVFSRPRPVSRVDKRTHEGRLVEATIADLTAHVGGSPSATQSIVIHAVAILRLRLAAALGRYATGTDCESLDRHVAFLANSMTRNCVLLGLDPVRAPEMTLERYLELKAATS